MTPHPGLRRPLPKGEGAVRPGEAKKWKWIFAIILLMTYSALTIHRSRDWRTSVSLLQATLRTAPDSAKMHYALGLQYARAGEFTKAGSEFQRCVDIDPEHFEGWRDLGRLALQDGRWAEAIRHYEKALALRQDPAVLSEYRFALRKLHR